MIPYSTLADDYYVNLTLNTEMQLPTGRETVLEFFERVQRTYPTMHNFYSRENGDFVLEDDKEHGHQRWKNVLWWNDAYLSCPYHRRGTKD